MFLNKTKISILVIKVLIAIGLIGIIITGAFETTAADFLNKVCASAMSNLAAASVLKILSGTLDIFSGFSDIFDYIFNFLMISNLLIAFQIILLKISGSLIIKIIAVTGVLLLFIKPVKRVASGIIIIVLMINPGLSIYINGVNYIYEKSGFNKGNEIESRLQNVKSIIESDNKNNESSKIEEADHKKNIFGRLFDKTIAVKEMVTSFGKDLSDKISKVTVEISRGLMEIVINYTVMIISLFFILPFLYFFILYSLIKSIVRSEHYESKG